MPDETAAKINWSFWVIGGVTLLYNLAGCGNFIMQLNPDAVANMPETIRLFIESRPVWATGAFALAVIGAAVGCGLMLLRKPAAYSVFIVSFAGAVLTLVDTFMRSAPMNAVIGNLVQLAVTAFLIGYARWAARKYQV